ncbi:pre-mrna splicing factor rna, partial [Cystoisospora suis]
MEALERLSVISRITTELHNHWGLDDRDLAEFIVHLGEEASSLEDFSSQLKENGASVSSSLAISLYTAIQKLSAKKKKKAVSSSSSSASGNVASHSSSHDGSSSLEDKKEINGGGEGGDLSFLSSLSLISREKGEKDDRLKEKEKKFPGLCRPNDVSRPELFLERPSEDAPLSSHALKLLEAEQDEKELLKEQKEALKKSHFPQKRNEASERQTHSSAALYSKSDGRKSNAAEEEEEVKKPPAHYYGSSGPMIRYAIYEGVVEKVLEFGCFVRLQFTDEGTRQGLLHVVDMTPPKSHAGGDQRPRQPQEIVHRNMRVKVKILAIAGSKISLSMREVDQETGRDLKPRGPFALNDEDGKLNGSGQGSSKIPQDPEAEQREKAGVGRITGIALESSDSRKSSQADSLYCRKRKLMSDFDKWENQQLLHSGLLSREEHPLYDEDLGILPSTEVEEDVEVEIREDEPLFLRGQTTRTGMQLSPVKILANPDGSLARAAATATALSKERREIRNAQESAILDSIPKDMSRPWEDPAPGPGERTIAQALK